MRICFVVALLLATTSVNGSIYYVATNGNDNNPGTISAPFATWGKLNSVLISGDIAYIRGGTYHSEYTGASSYHVRWNGLVGTATDTIKIWAYPGESPVLDLSTTPVTNNYAYGLYIGDCDFLWIKGLRVTGLTQTAAAINGLTVVYTSTTSTHILYDQCVADNSGGWGFRVSGGSSYIYFKNCDAHHLADPYTNYGGADGFQIDGATTTSTNIYYDGCRAWCCSDDGWDMYRNNGYIELNNCWSFWNGYSDEGNTTYNSNVNQGNGIKLGPSNTNTPTTFLRKLTNCIAANNKEYGIEVNVGNSYPYTCAMYVYNNIAYGNTGNVGLMMYMGGIDANHIIRNNIAINNNHGGTQYSVSPSSTHSNNSWNGVVTVNDGDFKSINDTDLDAARNTGGTLPEIDFLHLYSSSDLIDKGVNVGLPFNSSAPDLGAFETNLSTNPVAPVYVSSVVENATSGRIDITYNLTLANIVPATSNFTVTVNSASRSVSSVAISGAKVLLTLASPVINGDNVTVAYTKPSTNPIQTSAGGQAASFTAKSVTNNVSPVTPVYVSSAVENATPGRIDITYNLTLANIMPAASNFTVTVNSASRSVSSVAISGAKVLLTLASPVIDSDNVTVAYTKPSANPIQTSAGGQAASFTAKSVTNNVSPVAPVYVSSAVENATPGRIDIAYNLTLANIMPAASNFTVTVNSASRSVSSVAISGAKVLLTLSSPVINGDNVTVAYLKPSTNPLQTSAGGQAASFSAKSVTNNVSPVTPVYVSSAIENATPGRIDITYNLTLANIVPATSNFTVTVNSASRSVSSVAISGAKVLLTLVSPVINGDNVTVAYTKPSTNPIQTSAGGQAASFTAKSVTNNVSPVIPAYVSSAVENATPGRIDITYNLTLANIVPAASDFTVTVNSASRSVSSVAISGAKVLLTLSSPVINGDNVTVAYSKPSTNPLQTSAGGQAASYTAKSVTNNVSPVIPVYVSSAVENATPGRIDITYNLTLANIVPAASDFTVTVNSTARSVSSVAISGAKVLLTLSSPVINGDNVTVAYSKPSGNPIQTPAGGQAASFTTKSVTNNVANISPEVSLSSPTKSTSYVAPATITIEAAASDKDGTISKVEFYNGATKLGEIASSQSYSYTWKEVSEGTYSISAVAVDNKNARTASSVVSVTVLKSGTATNQDPVVSITSPTKGKKVNKHENIVIEAVASDPDGSISKVEFKSGTVTLAEITTAPYTYLWQDIDTGTYIITAIATDNLGAIASSTILELRVEDFYDVNSEMIKIFPNPTHGQFTVDMYAIPSFHNNRITIVSLAGKTVYNEIIPDEESIVEFDLSHILAGTYVLIVTSSSAIIATKKFIKI